MRLKTNATNLLLALSLAFNAIIFVPAKPAYAASGTIYVNTTDDIADGDCMLDSDCSLRDAIALSGPGTTIEFVVPLPAMITLTSGELQVDQDLIIAGSGSDQLSILGNNANRAFYISGDRSVLLTGMTIVEGYSATYGVWHLELR